MTTPPRSPERRAPVDAGMTLVELLVAMGIFLVVIAVFMSGIVIMTKSTATASAVSDATSTARKVMDRFDKQVRYATAINAPGTGTTSGATYVEYMMPSQTAGATPVCVQWRYDGAAQTLALRTWPNSSSPSPSAWGQVASDVRNDAFGEPIFTFEPANEMDGNYLVHQQLTVTVDIGTGTAAGAKMSATYAARNSSMTGSPSNTLTADGQSSTPVCLAGVGRP